MNAELTGGPYSGLTISTDTPVVELVDHDQSQHQGVCIHTYAQDDTGTFRYHGERWA